MTRAEEMAIPDTILTAATGLLVPFIPELTNKKLLQALKKTTPEVKDPEILRPLTIKQTAELLQVSRCTIHRWIAAGKLRFVRFGDRSIRIAPESIQSMMKGE